MSITKHTTTKYKTNYNYHTFVKNVFRYWKHSFIRLFCFTAQQTIILSCTSINTLLTILLEGLIISYLFFLYSIKILEYNMLFYFVALIFFLHNYRWSIVFLLSP